MDYEITFEEAIYGTTKVIEVPIKKTCPECNGTGSAPGSSPIRCPVCQGSGIETIARQMGFTRYITQQTCSRCHGRGEIVDKPCPVCKGTGRSKENEKVRLEIPPGVDSGYRLRIKGKGEEGRLGGPRGDLYIRLIVKEHEFYKRRGNDIIVEVSIPYPMAVLGGEFIIPTPYGPEKIKIPKQTKDGNVLRLRGKGVKQQTPYGTNFGDMHVIVHIDIPKNLSDKEKKLLQELKEVMKLPKNQEKLFKKLIEEAKQQRH